MSLDPRVCDAAYMSQYVCNQTHPTSVFMAQILRQVERSSGQLLSLHVGTLRNNAMVQGPAHGYRYADVQHQTLLPLTVNATMLGRSIDSAGST